jgi:hypothetical protein
MIPLWLLTCQAIWSALPTNPSPAASHRVPLPVSKFTFSEAEDQDFDSQPDEWVRRKGPGFPRYVTTGIDKTAGVADETSLVFKANSGAATYYSPLIPIDQLHTYHFEGRIRTEGMRHDAAMLTVSLLDHARRRIHRVSTRPVMGTHAQWVPVHVGPIDPDDDVRFAVIGCHLVPGAGEQHDIGGKVWFDDLTLGQLPRMHLESNFIHHFRDGGAPLKVRCEVSGLDAGHRYGMELSLRDDLGNTIHATRETLTADPPIDPLTRHLMDYLEPQSVGWEVKSQPPGYYSVSAILHRDGEPVEEQHTTMTVLQLIDKPRPLGEFGWSLSSELGRLERKELPQIAAQAGINWLKYPMWRAIREDDPQAAGEVAEMLDRLNSTGVIPIALLSDPPPAIRSQFSRNWQGVSEVFGLSTAFWKNSLEPIVARYSSTIPYWQLGGETDTSFLGLQTLPPTLTTVRDEFRNISLKASIGVTWRWETPDPDSPAAFLSMTAPETMSAETLTKQITSVNNDWQQHWVLIRLSQLPTSSKEDRAAELTRLMIAAKMAGAKHIFVDDVYNPQCGLLHETGAPTELFLPWRTVALALQQTEHLGPVAWPGGSSNAVFVRGHEACVVAWNAVEVTETAYLGERPIECDLWGRQKPLMPDPETREVTFTVGPIPKLFLNCSAPVLKWMLTAKFEVGQARSEYGGHHDAILIRNPFPQGVSGEVTLDLPPDWEAEPQEWKIAASTGESLRLPLFMRLPPNANLGDQPTTLHFRIDADRPYRFRVNRPYAVGLGDVALEVIDRKLPDGRLEIEQILTNRTAPPETLNFRCSLFIPNVRRQRLQVTKLGQGSDHKFYYLPNADQYRGQELWLRLEQDGGRRVMNYRWKLGEDW